MSLLTKCVPSEHLGKVKEYPILRLSTHPQILSIFGAIQICLGMAMSYVNTLVSSKEWKERKKECNVALTSLSSYTTPLWSLSWELPTVWQQVGSSIVTKDGGSLRGKHSLIGRYLLKKIAIFFNKKIIHFHTKICTITRDGRRLRI